MLARRSGLVAAAVMLAAVVSVGGVAAQARDEVLVREGVELRAQGRDAEALARFREAWTLRPTPRTRAQMGWAAQALGRWREAEQMLREAASAQGDPWIEGSRAELARSLTEVGERLGDVVVECDVAGAQVFADGELVGTTPLSAPLRIPLGAVTLRVTAEGHSAVTREGVRVRAGEVAREHISLTAAPVARTHQDAPTSTASPPPTVVVVPMQGAATSRSSTLAPLGITLLGLGAAGAALSALGFSLREAAVDRYSEGVRGGACVGADLPAATETDARCYEERSTMETWGVLRWVGLGVGAVGVATGIVLLVVDGSRGERRAFACAPWTHAVGATCAARF